MSKKQKLVPFEYIIDENKKTVVYAVKAHGMLFVGTARCGEHDKFDVERGKAIAQIRANIAQRKCDLELTREFISTVKLERDRNIRYSGVASPHYMRAIQSATAEERAQLVHIKELKDRLKTYTLDM